MDKTTNALTIVIELVPGKKVHRAPALPAKTLEIRYGRQLPKRAPAFGLTANQLPDVEIGFHVSSTKTNSGFDAIVIRRTGKVEGKPPRCGTLRRQSAKARWTGLVLRLLQLLAAEGI